MFANPFWQALTTEHASFAIGQGLARRYPADVIPFGGVAESSVEAMSALRDLLEPGEILYVTGDELVEVEGLIEPTQIPGWQMHFEGDSGTETAAERHDDVQVLVLGAAEAQDMVLLTDVAFPGFFRANTYRLGSYFGVRVDGELVALAGERIAVPGYAEISAVCTHPAHTGRGYAATLIRQVMRAQAAAGIRSFLHVAAANERAIALYERLGFVKTMPIVFHQLRRVQANQQEF
jgi:ribosomal protein S18 acetylase RimI-like enzyme